jgi:hypothetical protein
MAVACPHGCRWYGIHFPTHKCLAVGNSATCTIEDVGWNRAPHRSEKPLPGTKPNILWMLKNISWVNEWMFH